VLPFTAHMEISKATLSDLKELQTLSRKTFFETFSSGNTEENMREYLDVEFAEQKMKNELSNIDSVFYLAKEKDKLIGYLKINFANAQTELKEEKGMEVERIYVLKEFHGKNVGQLLFDKALEIAKAKNMDYLWLGVWEKNPRAIRFYEKNGFVQFGKHVFKVGADEQTDVMMRRELI
jgi:ribosomal protein S18 acetylase RimI-like enzyme